MSILSDSIKFRDYKNKIPSIQGPDELQNVIQEAKDLAETYVYDLKGVPRQLNRWLEYSKELGLYSGNTDNPILANSILFAETKKGAEQQCGIAEERLIAKMQELEARRQVSEILYFIGDVGIDYLYNPNPSYSTSAISQPIVTNQSPERLNEDAENDNTTISATIILEGDDREARLNQLLEYRNKKQLVKCVFNKVYDSMLITGINPEYDGTENSITIGVSFENLFVATAQRTKKPVEAFKTPLKEKTSVGKQGSKNPHNAREVGFGRQDNDSRDASVSGFGRQ